MEALRQETEKVLTKFARNVIGVFESDHFNYKMEHGLISKLKIKIL